MAGIAPHAFAMKIESTLEPFVWKDSQRMSGALCFRNTRVPVEALFGNLAEGSSLDEFLDSFEGVTREQAVAVLE